MPAIEGHVPGPERRRAGDDQPLLRHGLKIANDPFVGNLTFFRVYSGTLKSGSYVLNAARGQRGRSGGQMHANHREDIEEVRTGDIAAVIGLKATTTGDTLCTEDAPIVLEAIVFSGTGHLGRRRAQDKADQDKMALALQAAKGSRSTPTRTAARR